MYEHNCTAKQHCCCRATSNGQSGEQQEAWNTVGQLSRCLNDDSSTPAVALQTHANGSSSQVQGKTGDKAKGSSGQAEGKTGGKAKGSSGQAEGSKGGKAEGSSAQAEGRKGGKAKGSSGQTQGSKGETAQGSKSHKAKGSSCQHSRQNATAVSAHQGTQHTTGVSAKHSQTTQSTNNNSAQQVLSVSGRDAQASSHHASGRSDPSSATRVVDKPNNHQHQAVRQSSVVMQLPGPRAISCPSQRTRSAADVHEQGSTSFGEASALVVAQQRQQAAPAQGQASSAPANGKVRPESLVVPKAGAKRASMEPMSNPDTPSQPRAHASHPPKPGKEQPAAVTFPFKLLHLKGSPAVPTSLQDTGSGKSRVNRGVVEGAGPGPSAGGDTSLAAVPNTHPASLHEPGELAFPAFPAAANHAHTYPASEVSQAAKQSGSAAGAAAEVQLGPEPNLDPASGNDRAMPVLPAAPVHAHKELASGDLETVKHAGPPAGGAPQLQRATKPSEDPASVRDTGMPPPPSKARHAHAKAASQGLEAGARANSAASTAAEVQLATMADPDPANVNDRELPMPLPANMHEHMESSTQAVEAGRQADPAVPQQTPAGNVSKLPASTEVAGGDEGAGVTETICQVCLTHAAAVFACCRHAVQLHMLYHSYMVRYITIPLPVVAPL